MPSLKSDLVRRVDRLPKPIRTGDALIPLFEAISNSIHSVQTRFKSQVAKRGHIEITVSKAKGRRPLTILVVDNGIGLDKANFEAFSTTDTDHKIEIGGKGVGRLLWLDCFQSIHVESVYQAGAKMRRRSFDFSLRREEQITNYEDKLAEVGAIESGMRLIFNGLRDNGYAEKFPSRLGFVFRHVTSHFLPTFIGKKSPTIVVNCEGDIRTYPGEIDTYIHRRTDVPKLTSDDFGELRLVLMECDKIASADLQGKHFVHFIAHDRTVKSQAIDGKLGLRFFGDDGDRVFHACIFGRYLDRNVNQERTAFTFEDSVIDRIVNEVCMPQISQFLAEPLSRQRSEQGDIVQKIVDSYPSVAFGPVPELQTYVPLGELKDDAIFGHLSQQRYRRDERQAEKIRSVLSRLKAGKIDGARFQAAIAEASKAIEETEQRSLAEYVVRRKVVLDFLELLIRKVRSDTSDSSYQREDVLHSFICPMQINGTAEGPLEVVPASHDLWVVDERLTFAQYFSSDVSFDEMSKAYQSDERPDLLIFDRVHGLRESEGASKVLLVEFKRPGRSQYADAENPQFQVQRYVKKLLSQSERDVRGRPVRLSANTVFYCFIVADCLGRLDEWTDAWARTADGRGRIFHPQGAFKGSIELIEWDALIKDARDRNQAFFERAGIPGTSIFSTS
ncbi:MAG: hypothetical protein QOG13_1877 [Sphingomonadales bacterium]|nr:hypothetical protein [Sphingomonadales bacterium]